MVVRSLTGFAALLAIQLSAQTTLTFRSTDRTLPIDRGISVLSGTSDQLTPSEALASTDFSPITTKVPNLGLSDDHHWLRFTIENASERAKLVLNIAHPDLDELDVYLVPEGRDMQLVGRAGQGVPAEQRIQRDREFSFDVPLAPGERGTLLLRTMSLKQLQLPMTVSDESTYSEFRATRNMYLGGYIGIMLVMALYNLFVHFSIRDNGYLLYVLYILSVALTQLAFTGIAPFYFWSESTWFSPKATLLLTIATAILATEFIKVFIHTKERVPHLHVRIKYFYILFAVCVLLEVIGLPLVAYKMTQLVSGIFAMFLIYLVFSVWRKGSRQAGFFLIAWSVFLVGTVVFVMKDMGFLPYNAFTIYTMPLGSAIEGVLLSFGLADKINILRKEKELSQAEALASSLENERIIRDQNVILEQKVTERTHALQESNLHLKQTQSQLVDAEKMATLGQLTAGIAHEINNPVNFIASNIPPLRRNLSEMLEVLAAYQALHGTMDVPALNEIRAHAQQLGLDESIEELDDIIRSIEEGAGRTADIVRGLRNFSRLDEDDLKSADINEGIRSTITVLGSQLNEHALVDLALAELPKVDCYAGKLNQVFMNMLNNAVQAIRMRPDGSGPGRISIGTQLMDDVVKITISDNGIGMGPEVRNRIFEPFYTTKDVGEGTGLGLSIAYSIVEKHNGSIQVESAPGEGASFIISIPLHQTVQHQKRA